MRKERFEIGSYWLAERPDRKGWHAAWFDKRTRQTRYCKLGTQDVFEAKKLLANFVVRNGEPGNERPSDFLLATAFIRYYDQHGRNIPSADVARGALRYWTEFWGDAAVSDLTPRRQSEFRAWLKAKGFRNAYVSRILSVGRAALNWAVTNQEVSAVPVIVNVTDRSDSEECYTLTMSEVRLLMTAARKVPHIWSYVVLGLCTMGRPSSILEIRPSQVDLEHSFVDLNPAGRKQTKKYRATVPIPDAARRILEVASCERFIMWNGKPIRSIKKSFKAVVRSAGLPEEVCPYSLRHTMAKALRKRKVDSWEVDGMLGHRRPGTTELYARFDPDYYADGRLAIDAYMSELGVDLTPPACQVRAKPTTGDNLDAA